MAQIDPVNATLTLAVEKASRLLRERIGELVLFDISENVKVRSEGSEPGVFDLEFEDIEAEVDAVRVLGEEVADGIFQITRIVLYVEEEEPQQEERTEKFTATGKVTQIDATDLTVTLNVEKANRVLRERIGESVPFLISEKVKVKIEGSEPGAFNLSLDEIKAGIDHIRVLGKALADGTLLITRIVVCLEEGEPRQKRKSVPFTAAGRVTQIDSANLTMTLAIEKASHVLRRHIGESVPFVIKKNVNIRTDGPESTISGLDLDDFVVAGDYLEVLGRKLVYGTFQITDIAAYLDE